MNEDKDEEDDEAKEEDKGEKLKNVWCSSVAFKVQCVSWTCFER